MAAFSLIAGTSVWADAPTVSVDWSLDKGTNRHVVAITIKNLSDQELKIQHPANRLALAFIVMDDNGNVLTPEGVAKVDPRRQDISLKVAETYEYAESQWEKLAEEKGLRLPFLTGTGLFAYKLKEGKNYRLTVIYRPNAEGEGIASAEKVLTFK
jgi:hypothetical protein